nr:hypothetical protein [Pirellula staleyi]
MVRLETPTFASVRTADGDELSTYGGEPRLNRSDELGIAFDFAFGVVSEKCSLIDNCSEKRIAANRSPVARENCDANTIGEGKPFLCFLGDFSA